MISLAKGWQVGLAAALHNESQLFTKRFAVPMPRGKCKSLYSGISNTDREVCCLGFVLTGVWSLLNYHRLDKFLSLC